jgi:hypothetical protein
VLELLLLAGDRNACKLSGECLPADSFRRLRLKSQDWPGGTAPRGTDAQVPWGKRSIYAEALLLCREKHFVMIDGEPLRIIRKRAEASLESVIFTRFVSVVRVHPQVVIFDRFGAILRNGEHGEPFRKGKLPQLISSNLSKSVSNKAHADD